ncbi:MAG TPA: DUF6152 family protein [Gammaproteobacteria bacterium]|nr:DUF6152 family protein [Gammaproteobacteria bacterium]
MTTRRSFRVADRCSIQYGWHVLLASLPALSPVIAAAHHSVAGRFDTASVIEVEGEITSVHWRSPHVEFTLAAIDESGARESWLLEAAAPSTLIRSGLSADVIEVGDQVRVAGWAPMTDKREMFLQNVLLPSGEELLLWVTAQSRWSEEQANDFAFWRQTEGDGSRPELGIFRVWSSSLALPRRSPRRAASDYPLTAAARDAVQAYSSGGENLAIQACVPKGMPLIMEQPYPIEFRRNGNDIALHLEEYDAVRMIDMEAEAPPPDAGRSPLGFSTGRWDGAALVVTTRLLSWPWFSQGGIPQSPQATLTERFTPAADGSRLEYELTSVDPVNFTEPVTQDKAWLYLPDQQVRPYECTPAPAE